MLVMACTIVLLRYLGGTLLAYLDTGKYNNNNNNRFYYLEFSACKLRVYALSILFYEHRYSYALLISLKCSWASDFDIFLS